MNRYVSHGLVQDASEGKHVVFCGARASETRLMFNQVDILASGVAPEPEPITGIMRHVQVSRANGAEGILFPGGGSIRFVSRVDQLVNSAADVVYLSAPDDEWVAVARDVVVSRGGEVMRP